MKYLLMVGIVVLSISSAAQAQHNPDRTMKLDVVELIKGERVEGDAKFTANQGKFSYWFATDRNLKTFLISPEKYEIQLGGGCARMGPLGGEGTPRLCAVHNGNVYIFASEACKTAFLSGPEKYLAGEDAMPASTVESRTAGRRLLGKAVDAIKCQAMIDAVSTYREVLARDEKHGETRYHVTKALTLKRPGGVRCDECWNDACWSYVADGALAWTTDNNGTLDLVASQRDELMRNAGRHPYQYLWARDHKELVATTVGATRTITVPDEGAIEVELVSVHMHGATSTLGLDHDGKVRLMSYRGRGPNSTIGEIERVYSQFHVLNGLRVPGRVDVTFNGERVEESSGVFAEQVFDDPADAQKFERPDAKARTSKRMDDSFVQQKNGTPSNRQKLVQLREELTPGSTEDDVSTRTQRPSAIDVLGKLVGGEWIYDGTSPDGGVFRVRNVLGHGPDGVSIVGKSWLGNADGMFEHGSSIVYRQPGTGKTMFINIDEHASVSQGEIHATATDTVEWNWNHHALDGKKASYHVTMKFTDDDHYEFTLKRQTEEGAWQEMVNILFERVAKAPPELLKVRTRAAHE